MAGTTVVRTPATPMGSLEREAASQVNKIVTDLETLRAALDAGGVTAVTELMADHATFKAVVDDLKTQLSRVIGASDNLITTPTLGIGSTPTAVANVAFTYRVNGVGYAKAAVAAGTAPGNDVIPSGTFGACAFDIGTDGTVDAVEAADNATGYASAALAAAGLPAVATDHVRMGYVTASKSDGNFTFGTTDLNAANTTVAYTNGTTDTAISTSSPATLSASVPSSTAVNEAGDLTAALIQDATGTI